MAVKEDEFFEHPRWSTNKLLLSFVGQWPYQNKIQRILIYSASFIISITALPAQIKKVVVNWTDWLVIIPTVSPILVHVSIVAKTLNSIVSSGRMRQLLNRIRRDWNQPMGSERSILEEYADDSRMLTLVYAGWLYVSLFFFLLISILPHVLIVNGWANMSETTLYPIPIEYTSHDEDYYIYIQPYLCGAIILMISIAVAADGLFVVFVQHGCSLFSIVGYRLEHMLENADLDFELNPSRKADEPFWIVVDCITKHNEAIEYAMLLDSAYSQTFLLMLGFNMLTLSFTGLQVVWGATPEALDEAFRQGVFGGSQILHLLFLSLFSQRLTDHSLGVFHALTLSNWYKMSLRTRKLIHFMLIKSMIPYELKAGKIWVMSIANFGMILRTSMSYLTILASME